ncbi:MAG: 30S ribosomal protein S20 [Verrucomicrobiae bacterium]|nr:30S ribosomal protein S20 [Verrucomicrobiae bacterium]
MANTKSALKRVRQTKVRTARNRALKSNVKSARKSALAAIEAGDATTVQTAYNQFASAADKAAKRGAIPKGTADRLKGRIAARMKAVQA